VIFVAVVSAFFALCIGYIRWCDQIIGADRPDLDVTESAATAVDVPA